MRSPLPASHGTSLKSVHFKEILAIQPDIDWFEVHPENYMSDGGLDHYFLEKIIQRYPLSMHGVGLSLGSSDGIEKQHLDNLKKLIERYKPAQFSEHLAWTKFNGNHLNDLLPLPLIQETLDTVIDNINKTQDYLGVKLLIENPSTYIDFNQQTYSETDFLNTLCEKTGCGLLLDINNIVVTCSNHMLSKIDYINNINTAAVGEIHLAGHKTVKLTSNKKIKIDDHGSEVSDEVWQIFEQFIKKSKQHYPVLVEWDTDIPSLEKLTQEAKKAKHIMQQVLKN